MLTCFQNPQAGAAMSPDRVYRYRLYRRWGDGPLMLFIGLNPSVADEKKDDPTLRRMKGFAQREGCGGIEVVNLFALVATEPEALLRHPDPVGPDCDLWLSRSAAVCMHLVACWGSFGHPRLKERAKAVLLLLAGRPIRCLGLTLDGHPKHPLYLSAKTPLEVFRV